MHFILKKKSKMKRDIMYSISIDVENFSKIMPKHFKSLRIVKRIQNEIFVDEKIYFLNVKVKHIIIHPDIHEVHILSGMMKDTSFIEHYEKTSEGTNVTIDVSIRLNGISRILSPLKFLFKIQMSKVMNEFIRSVEKFTVDSNKEEN